MPTGGVYSAGSGLRLQPTSPGVTDQGNWHISGTGLADGNLSGLAGWVIGGVRQGVQFIGENFTFPAGMFNVGAGGALAPAGFGNNMTLGNALRGLTSTLETATFGNNINNGARGNSVFGYGCTVDTAGSATSGGYNVVMGRASSLSSSTLNTAGGCNTQIGSNITGVTSSFCIVIGNAIGYGGKSNGPSGSGLGNAVLIGSGIQSASGTNLIVISSSYDGSLATQKTETRSNAIVIGDLTHTVIEIGGKPFQNVSTATAKTVNDANFAATSQDNGALYSAITAARTVTLPAANSVLPGFIFRTVDFSGAASAVNTITTNPAGADTIVGGGSPVINTAYGGKRFMSDGATKWSLENNW